MIMIGIGAFLLTAFIVMAWFILSSIYMVRQAEALVIERFGRFDRILGPGMHFVAPFISRPRKVYWSFVISEDGKRYYREARTVDRIDLRESVYDFPKQNVITKDNVTMEINALLYYQITDPKAAVYEVSNLPEAIEKLTQTTLRNVIGSMDLDASLVSRDVVNEKLRLILDEATDKWGVKINRVELQEVNPPIDIRHAMEKQMRAERDRRATILESEGKKRAAILEAEGEQESQVLRAQGAAQAAVIQATAEAESRFKIVEAEAQAIALIKGQLPEGDPLPYLIAMQYIKALPEVTKGTEGKTVVIPYEMGTLAGSITSMQQIFTNLK